MGTVEISVWVVSIFWGAFGVSVGLIIKWLYDGAMSQENQTMIQEHEKRLEKHDLEINAMQSDISAIKQNGEKILGEIRTVNARLNDFVKLQGVKK